MKKLSLLLTILSASTLSALALASHTDRRKGERICHYARNLNGAAHRTNASVERAYRHSHRVPAAAPLMFRNFDKQSNRFAIRACMLYRVGRHSEVEDDFDDLVASARSINDLYRSKINDWGFTADTSWWQVERFFGKLDDELYPELFSDNYYR